MKSVIVYALDSSAGNPVYENLLVEELSEGTFKLMASPGLVLGLAKGDVFKLTFDKTPSLIQRGNNISIQIYKGDEACNQHTKIKEILLGSLNSCSLDGMTERQLVFTVSVSEGFPQIENALNTVISSCPGYEWYFGNVYDLKDGITPLNWWSTSESKAR